MLDGDCSYTLYPLQLNTNELVNRMEFYEDLVQYCGFCFRRTDNLEALISTVDGEGLFDWSMYINQLQRANMRGAKTICEKQLTVIGYFFEKCYDTCLSPRHNVSNNPGFESILGVFNNAKSE